MKDNKKMEAGGAEVDVQHLASEYTPSFQDILNNMGVSLFVTTYQAGKLIVIRSEGERVNTRFSSFKQPMGLARGENKFALGVQSAIHQFGNIPANAKKVKQGSVEFDACYQHRSTHVTGDIDIHEMGYDKNGELWFINTKFSCLCTSNGVESFVPRWRPPFITSYNHLDRCHLNGLCFADGEPRYVTALGATDEPLGWRKNKAAGGVLIDIKSNRILADQLCMPHSPRLYRGKLWLLESGKGSLSYYDLKSKKVVQVASLPGFTRGIDFCGNLAFIGLSKVRESATFGGLPLTKNNTERVCGVWVVNVDDGTPLGFVRFLDGIQEIFAVAVMPHRFPEILALDHPLQHTTYVIPQDALDNYRPPETPIELAAPHFEKGNDLYTSGDKLAAVTSYLNALKVQQDHLPARFNLGVSLHDLGRLEDAEKELLAVVANESQYFEAYYMLGSVYEKRGVLPEAQRYYEYALSINPDFLKAQMALQRVLSGEFQTVK